MHYLDHEREKLKFSILGLILFLKKRWWLGELIVSVAALVLAFVSLCAAFYVFYFLACYFLS